ncbi:MAG: DUF4160 domain-containing protein [Chitinivibrionales bacterium]|nr:DUF4160 domain-containing protein [Chitinivibrionales bacterium]
MSEICRFFGIVITMYIREHNPPHFHARYGEYAAEIDFQGRIIDGWLPPRIMGLVIEWLLLYRKELEENWGRIKEFKNPEKIRPLE